MNKYTIVYSVYIGLSQYVTQYERVETDNLLAVLKDYDAWFVFEGWPEIVDSWRDALS